MSAVRLDDLDARRRAATDFATNLVVLAGAGTGKTSLLVERMLNAVGGGQAPLERIAAITFTEKAAGEMRTRLAIGLERLRALASGEIDAPDLGREADRAWLHLSREGGEDPSAVRDRALAALDEVDRAAVATIHAFCAELLRRHPVEAGVDPDFAVDSDAHFRARFDAWWEGRMDEELAADSPRAAAWRASIGRFAPAEIRELARSLASFRIDARLLQPPFAPPDAVALLVPRVREVRDGLARLRDEATGMNIGCEEVARHAVPALDALLAGGPEAYRAAWDADATLRKRADSPPKSTQKYAGPPWDEAEAILAGARRLLKGLERIDETAFTELLEAVAPAALAFREAYLRDGFVSFDGLLTRTRALLRDRPAVRRAVRDRFELLSVDEFQDTDPVQYEIVLFLAERDGDRPADDAWAVEPAPGRLFVVGDAKQSIYRFRGADFAAYRRAVEKILDAGGARLSLTSNFRSTDAVLEPVNRLFGAGGDLWQPSRTQPDYEPIRAVRAADEDVPGVEIWRVAAEEALDAEGRRAAEGRAIANGILDMRRRGRIDGFGDVTMLFRAFASISDYLRPLRQAGIPFVVDGGSEFLERPEVLYLMAALRVLALPSDGAGLLAHLRSPAGAVSDRELLDYRNDGGAWDWRRERPPAELCPGISAAFERLRALEEATRDVPADAAIRRALRETGLLTLGAAAFEGAQQVANLQKLAASAGELARDGKLALDEVLDALRTGRMEDIKSDRPLTDEGAQAIRITSIHRMKGLENRVVLLPDLAVAERGAREGGKEPARVAFLGVGGAALSLHTVDLRNAADHLLSLDAADHERSEERRVFYVAATRARDLLVLVDGSGAAKRTSNLWRLEALRAWGYAHDDPPAATADGARLAGGAVLLRKLDPDPSRGAREVADRPPPADAAERFARAREAASAAAMASAPISPSGLEEDPSARRLEGDDAARPPAPAVGRDGGGRAVGIALHRALESWSGDGEGFAYALEVAAVEAARETGEPADKVSASCAEVARVFLDSPLRRRLSASRVLGREVPVLHRAGTGRVRGSIDLLLEEDGAPVIVDYKTDREQDDARLVATYGPQLDAYRQAVAEALGSATPPRAELWLLRHGRAVEIGPLQS